MARLKVYSIHDVASKAYAQPFTQQADGEAARTFTDIAIDPQSKIGKFPKDYTLWRIGTFETNSGMLKEEIPEQLMTAMEAIAIATQE